MFVTSMKVTSSWRTPFVAPEGVRTPASIAKALDQEMFNSATTCVSLKQNNNQNHKQNIIVLL